jgi:D-sedoheptulose 7-phosphate isomerase
VEQVVDLIVSTFKSGKTLYICGNGGSAADAQHIAAELVGRFSFNRPGLRAVALTTDTSFLTAWSNDNDFETVFSRQIESFGKTGDVLLAISTSGRSKNVILAVKAAKQIGMTTIGLVGNSGGTMIELIDYPLVVTAQETACIQEVHLITYHYICGLIESKLFRRLPTERRETNVD